MTWLSDPARTSARLKPCTPSPFLISPRPVSHAESTTSFVPHKSNPATSSAVSKPSSSPLLPSLAPASAKPERSSGSLTRAANLLSRRPENVSVIGCEFADGAGAGFVVTWAIVGNALFLQISAVLLSFGPGRKISGTHPEERAFASHFALENVGIHALFPESPDSFLRCFELRSRLELNRVGVCLC